METRERLFVEQSPFGRTLARVGGVVVAMREGLTREQAVEFGRETAEVLDLRFDGNVR